MAKNAAYQQQKYASAKYPNAGRRWETTELDLVDNILAAGRNLRYAARLLGRPRAAILGARRRKGRARPIGHARNVRNVARLHRKGMIVTDIAARLGHGRNTVMRALKELGLKPNPVTPERMRLGYDTACRRLRVKSIRQVQLEDERYRAAMRGYCGCTLREADLLDAAQAGPLSAREVARALGVTTRRGHEQLRRHFQELVRRGYAWSCRRRDPSGVTVLHFGVAPKYRKGPEAS